MRILRFIIQIGVYTAAASNDSATKDQMLIQEPIFGERLFRLALVAVETTNFVDWWVKTREENINKLVEDMGMSNIDFVVENEIKIEPRVESILARSRRETTSTNTMSSYIAEMKEVNGQILAYKQRRGQMNRRPIPNVSSNLTVVCKDLANMTGRELGVFLQYCFNLTLDHEFIFQFMNLVHNKVNRTTGDNSIERKVVNKLETWLRQEYIFNTPFDANLFRKTMDPKDILNTDVTKRKFYIIVTPSIVKLRITNIQPYEISKVFYHLWDRLGTNFPIREVEFYKISFKDGLYPLLVMVSEAVRNMTRITFNECEFQDGIFRIHPEKNKQIMKNVTKLEIRNSSLIKVEGDSEILNNIEVKLF